MKFTCEVDTESKTATFLANGKEIEVENFCISSYEYCGCNGKMSKTTSISYTQEDKDESSVSNYITFGPDGICETTTKYAVAKEIGRIIANVFSAEKLVSCLKKA